MEAAKKEMVWYEYCMCNYGPLKEGQWCPRCWPDKQPKEEQLQLPLTHIIRAE